MGLQESYLCAMLTIFGLGYPVWKVTLSFASAVVTAVSQLEGSFPRGRMCAGAAQAPRAPSRRPIAQPSYRLIVVAKTIVRGFLELFLESVIPCCEVPGILVQWCQKVVLCNIGPTKPWVQHFFSNVSCILFS